MLSENASSDTAQMKIKLILKGKNVVIEDRDGFSVDLESPILKLSELYTAVFAEIDEPVTIDVTASSDVMNSKEAKLIFQNVKTIIDNAMKEINEGLADLAVSESEYCAL